MAPRNPVDPDVITRAEAAALLGISEDSVSRLRREGLIGTREGLPSYSRAEIVAYLNNPWLTGVQAAEILGVGHTRVTQLANADRILPHRCPGQSICVRLRLVRVAAWLASPAPTSVLFV